MKDSPLYTLGYGNLNQADLIPLLDALDVSLVVDVRSKPVSRRAGFGGRQLEALLGTRYTWRGDTLGGIPLSQRKGQKVAPGVRAVSPKALDWIIREAEHGARICLLCLEHAPGDCHRHHAITLPLLVSNGLDSWHIYNDLLVATSELNRADRDDDEPDGVPW